jgi:hypothetical protein
VGRIGPCHRPWRLAVLRSRKDRRSNAARIPGPGYSAGNRGAGRGIAASHRSEMKAIPSGPRTCLRRHALWLGLSSITLMGAIVVPLNYR